MVSYSAVIWANSVPKRSKPTARIQRVALMMMGSFLCSTPTASLEVILCVIPLDLFLKQEAHLAAMRIGSLES